MSDSIKVSLQIQAAKHAHDILMPLASWAQHANLANLALTLRQAAAEACECVDDLKKAEMPKRG